VSIDQAIDAFWQCARQRTAPGPEWMKRLSREEAYRVQLGVLARHVAAGERQAGWKVGLTSKAMQIQQKVHEPVLGFLLASGEQPSGTRFQYADLINPGFENELCLTVGRTLRGPGVTNDQAQAALSAMAPAFEIIEKRGDFAAVQEVPYWIWRPLIDETRNALAEHADAPQWLVQLNHRRVPTRSVWIGSLEFGGRETGPFMIFPLNRFRRGPLCRLPSRRI